jgi:hypothetical protein
MARLLLTLIIALRRDTRLCAPANLFEFDSQG